MNVRVKCIVMILVCLLGCGTMRNHPFYTIALTNSTVVAGAGVCAIECHGPSQNVAEGVLLTELAMSSTLAFWFGAWLVYYATEGGR